MSVRNPVVAGRFYEAASQSCAAQIEQMLPTEPITAELPERIVAAVVPHAGWVFSGDVAALVLAAIKQQQPVDTFVIFGAVHAVSGQAALMYESGQWTTPLGSIQVDSELAGEILAEAGNLAVADQRSHDTEHSIEVQVPIIQHLFEAAKIVPLMVPPGANAAAVGEAAGRAVAASSKNIVCIASTDLTHYGPSYGCTPMGTGPEGIRWAKDKNDQFFIDLALSMQADKLVDSARMYSSACGAGAVAAAVATAKQLGAAKGYLLAHTTSAEVMADKFGQQASDSVGYAGIVFG